MRIAYDYQIFCMQKRGGISRYVTRLAGQLMLSHQVRIFAPFHQNVHLRDLPEGIVRGQGLMGYPTKTSRLFYFVNRQLGDLEMRRWKPDLVHETYYSSTSTSSGKTPKVLTVYDMIHEIIPDSFSKDESHSRLKRKAVERADHVICISKNTRDDLIRLFNIPPEKVSYVHLGFEKFPCDSQQSEIVAPDNRPFLLYVGGRGGYKNFEHFLRSVAQSPRLMGNVGIIAFGGGTIINSEAVLINSLGFKAGQVTQISGNDSLLGAYYERAAAFVYPSLYEGFGLPPLEAMAHNCPVISSNTSSMPEVIGDAAEYFDPNIIEQMTGAIERVVYSSERGHELVDKGTKRLKSFSWKKCAMETAAIYERLMVER